MAEGIHFYLDAHIPLAVAQGLLQRGIDVLTTQAANARGFSDQQ